MTLTCNDTKPEPDYLTNVTGLLGKHDRQSGVE